MWFAIAFFALIALASIGYCVFCLDRTLREGSDPWLGQTIAQARAFLAAAISIAVSIILIIAETIS
ncbi:hypothetical protein [Ferrovibrio sp.]|uniref:hypothetical protein n=1 Tax=Ferrovibrio sp. TaxID=1917215 RepID=UPI0035AFA1EC